MNRHLESAVVRELECGGRILVTRLQYLGDVVLSLPLVRALSERYPNAEIDYLTRSPAAEMLEACADLSRVWRAPDRGESAAATLRLIRRIRGRGYAAAIDLYANTRSAIMTRLSGARLRIGGDRRGRRHLYTHAITVPDSVRAATHFHMRHGQPLDIGVTASKPTLTVPQHERNAAERLLEQQGIDTRREVVALHPGGKWEVKRWGSDSFAALGKRLASRYQVVVMCGPGEEPHLEAVRERLGERAAYLSPLPIVPAMAVVASVDGIVVCDGGLMHVAVAVGTPTVGLFGSSEPDIWFPYGELGPFVAACVPITCRPCHQHTCSHLSCLQRLSVDEVARKLALVLGAGRAGSSDSSRSGAA